MDVSCDGENMPGTTFRVHAALIFAALSVATAFSAVALCRDVRKSSENIIKHAFDLQDENSLIEQVYENKSNDDETIE
jgi:hypothetical protein